jgi:hypothetical protein
MQSSSRRIVRRFGMFVSGEPPPAAAGFAAGAS